MGGRLMNRRILWAFILVSAVAFGFVFSSKGHAEYGDIVLDRKIESMKKANVKPVVFPHWFHRIRFKCKVCHEDIFIIKKGANDINMKAIMEGNFCGKCHNGLVAWEPLYCDRCHSYKGR
jgi:c(7)-type cytochrome triheme protein